MRIRTVLSIVALLIGLLAMPVALARADCPGNLLANPGFEGGARKTENLGTSLSSSMVEGWLPWSVLGDATINREVEYKVIDAAASGDWYRVHSGNQSQKFFTTWGTHTAGIYQRVRVPAGSKVVFNIWVQIYTGERELLSGGQFISDLEWPKDSRDRRGPGLYRVTVGIDPHGNVPAAFGAPPSDATVWSAPVTEFETRRRTAAGVEYDAWVQLEVSAVAQGEWVTVYTRGMPEYAVKHNNSFWDDACLVALAPPTPTPRPTNTPLPTPEATHTPPATATPAPTATLAPSATPEPTATPIPRNDVPVVAATATPEAPTETPMPTSEPTSTPVATPIPEPTPTESVPLVPSAGGGALALYIGAVVLVAGAVALLLLRRR